MEDDARCCGTGHCMINAQGQCWCGQQWDGTKMCFAPPAASAPAAPGAPAVLNAPVNDAPASTA
jgi:hypothetical protein